MNWFFFFFEFETCLKLTVKMKAEIFRSVLFSVCVTNKKQHPEPIVWIEIISIFLTDIVSLWPYPLSPRTLQSTFDPNGLISWNYWNYSIGFLFALICVFVVPLIHGNIAIMWLVNVLFSQGSLLRSGFVTKSALWFIWFYKSKWIFFISLLALIHYYYITHTHTLDEKKK